MSGETTSSCDVASPEDPFCDEDETVTESFSYPSSEVSACRPPPLQKKPFPLQVEKTQIKFIGFQVGQSYHNRVVFWNTDAMERPFRIYHEKALVRKTGFYLSDFENAKLAKMNCKTVIVEFRPTEYRHYHNFFDVWSGQDYEMKRFHLEAYPMLELRQQIPSKIDFQTIPIGIKKRQGKNFIHLTNLFAGEKRTKTFYLNNPFMTAFEIKTDSELPRGVCVEPFGTFQIQAKETIEITIAVCLDEFITISLPITMTVCWNDYFFRNPHVVTVSACCKPGEAERVQRKHRIQLEENKQLRARKEKYRVLAKQQKKRGKKCIT